MLVSYEKKHLIQIVETESFESALSVKDQSLATDWYFVFNIC